MQITSFIGNAIACYDTNITALTATLSELEPIANILPQGTLQQIQKKLSHLQNVHQRFDLHRLKAEHEEIATRFLVSRKASLRLAFANCVPYTELQQEVGNVMALSSDQKQTLCDLYTHVLANVECNTQEKCNVYMARMLFNCDGLLSDAANVMAISLSPASLEFVSQSICGAHDIDKRSYTIINRFSPPFS